jgi:predicted amidohydrolase
MNDLIISAIQFDIAWEDKEANFRKLESLLKNIPSDSGVILLPEMFTTGFSMNSRVLAETMSGSTVEWMKKISISLDKVIAGSLIIYENNKYRNRFLWVQPDGKMEFYDKKHSFSPGGENENYTNGTKRAVFDFKEWKIFPSICYDLRFPYWLKNDLNYDILINVANWPKIRAVHWKTFLRSRAIENQAFAIGINRIGIDGRNIEYSGDSAAYDFDGNILTQLGNTEGIITTSFNKNNLMEYRNKFPFLKDMS